LFVLSYLCQNRQENVTDIKLDADVLSLTGKFKSKNEDTKNVSFKMIYERYEKIDLTKKENHLYD